MLPEIRSDTSLQQCIGWSDIGALDPIQVAKPLERKSLDIEKRRPAKRENVYIKRPCLPPPLPPSSPRSYPSKASIKTSIALPTLSLSNSSETPLHNEVPPCAFALRTWRSIFCKSQGSTSAR